MSAHHHARRAAATTARVLQRFRANDASSLVLTPSGNVSQWLDRSGYGFDLLAPAGKEPALLTAGNLTFVRFDGTTKLEQQRPSFSPFGNLDSNGEALTEWTYGLLTRVSRNQSFPSLWGSKVSPSGNPQSLFMDGDQYGLAINSSFPRIGRVSGDWQFVANAASRAAVTVTGFVSGTGFTSIPPSSTNDNAISTTAFGGIQDVLSWTLIPRALSQAEILAWRDRLASTYQLPL